MKTTAANDELNGITTKKAHRSRINGSSHKSMNIDEEEAEYNHARASNDAQAASNDSATFSTQIVTLTESEKEKLAEIQTCRSARNSKLSS